MITNQIEMVFCNTEIYDSSKANGFKETENYPIAWEVIFRNDNAGKKLLENVYEAFSHLPKDRGFVIGLEGEHTDMARCLECVFKDEHSLKKILNKGLDGLALYDENKHQVIPRQQLIDHAKGIGKTSEIAI